MYFDMLLHSLHVLFDVYRIFVLFDVYRIFHYEDILLFTQYFRYFSSLYPFLFLFNWSMMLYNVVLVSATQESESGMWIHKPLPSWTPPLHPHPTLYLIAELRTERSKLCRSFPLAIRFTHGNVFMLNLISQCIPPSPSPSCCPQASSLHLHFYSCPAHEFIYAIFLESRWCHPKRLHAYSLILLFNVFFR